VVILLAEYKKLQNISRFLKRDEFHHLVADYHKKDQTGSVGGQ
jgi:hypothetical protein